ncbi:rRNA cytosine-C5-methyltransferase [Echinicola sediminis]
MTEENIPKLPKDFELQMSSMMGDNNYKDFKAALLKPSKTSIRINTAKNYQLTAAREQVPWNKEGYFLKDRPKFTLDPLFHAGAYYVQEASSMFIQHILHNIQAPKSGLYLDLCAAPGGKSSLLSSYIGQEGLLVANEVIKARSSILRENMIKWGLGNTIVTNNDPDHFEPLEGLFDVVLVDAPCSGEGMFRKDPQARQEWSSDNVQLCASRQQRILERVGALPGENGYLIYSTCTFNRKENEEMIRFLTGEFAYEPVRIPLEQDWGIVETSTETADGTFYAYRFFPHLVDGEGFFVTVLKRPDDAFSQSPKKLKDFKHSVLKRVNKQEQQQIAGEVGLDGQHTFYKLKDSYFTLRKEWERHFEHIASVLSIKYFGIELGKLNKDQFIPTHDWAMSMLSKERYPSHEVNLEDALAYLRKEDLNLDIPGEGWILLTFEKLPLGWIKNIGNRINNYYPKEWRIRMRD